MLLEAAWGKPLIRVVWRCQGWAGPRGETSLGLWHGDSRTKPPCWGWEDASHGGSSGPPPPQGGEVSGGRAWAVPAQEVVSHCWDYSLLPFAPLSLITSPSGLSPAPISLQGGDVALGYPPSLQCFHLTPGWGFGMRHTGLEPPGAARWAQPALAKSALSKQLTAEPHRLRDALAPP